MQSNVLQRNAMYLHYNVMGMQRPANHHQSPPKNHQQSVRVIMLIRIIVIIKAHRNRQTNSPESTGMKCEQKLLMTIAAQMNELSALGGWVGDWVGSPEAVLSGMRDTGGQSHPQWMSTEGAFGHLLTDTLAKQILLMLLRAWVSSSSRQ